MNEAEFLVFQKITAIIETLIYGCGLATFFSPFMKRNRRKKYTPSGRYDKLFIIFRLRPASVCFIFYITVYYGTQITEKASSALRKRTVLSVPDPGHWIFIWKPDLRHVF